MTKQNYKWALVLSGGGARGLAHIGVIKGLEDAGFPKPQLVAGTSMGAITGGLYACGMTPGEMVRFVCRDFNISDFLDSFVFKLDGPVGKIFQTGQFLASLATNTGIDTGHHVLELFETLTDGKSFDETEIPFRCNAVDLLSGKEVVFRSGSVARAMRASMSFPGFFEPFVYRKMRLVDGGLWDNMPVDIARDEGFKHVLAVNVNRCIPRGADELKNASAVIFRSIECTLNAMDSHRTPAELTLNASDDITPFSFYRQKELIELGERTVKNNIDDLNSFFKRTAV